MSMGAEAMFELVYNGGMDSRNLAADVLCGRLQALAEEDENIVFLDADLMECSGVSKWAAKCPERVINCGIAEANMAGIAAGLSSAGFKPFIHSFAPFATRRCFDQIMLSGAYAGNNLTVIGTDPGVLAAFNGGTHMSFEDVGLMRLIPGATVISISDGAMLYDVLGQVKDMPGVKYLGIPRKQVKRVYADGSTFDIGKGNLLADGGDATIIACGIMVAEALEARRMLLDEGINAAVIDMFSVKPIDRALVEEYAEKTRLIVTAENHSVIGGLYSAVCEVVAGKAEVRPIAVNDHFGEVGPVDYLKRKYHLCASDIVSAVLNG